MYNDKKLRIAMIEKGYSVKALAKAIEINESTLCGRRITEIHTKTTQCESTEDEAFSRGSDQE